MRRDTLTVGPVWYKPTGQEYFGQHIDRQPSPIHFASTHVRPREILFEMIIEELFTNTLSTICDGLYEHPCNDTRWIALTNTHVTIHDGLHSRTPLQRYTMGCTYKHPRNDTLWTVWTPCYDTWWTVWTPSRRYMMNCTYEHLCVLAVKPMITIIRGRVQGATIHYRLHLQTPLQRHMIHCMNTLATIHDELYEHPCDDTRWTALTNTHVSEAECKAASIAVKRVITNIIGGARGGQPRPHTCVRKKNMKLFTDVWCPHIDELRVYTCLVS